MLNLAVKFYGLHGIQNIVLIGAGNVATHLGLAIQKTGRRIVQVYSRTEENARLLSGKLHADFTVDLKTINPDADLNIVSVTDDAIAKIVESLRLNGKLIVHTSGSVSMDVLDNCSKNFGVLYPLQTFSKTREIDLSTVPLCIEANSKDNLQLLEHFAKEISHKVVEVDSEKRKILHLAAVFASNFPNFMFTITDKILTDNKLDFDLLRPLILETAMKVQKMKPGEAQTGPASRGDEEILKKHIRLLREYPEYWKIYNILSEGIRGK
jgi:predicted short-subunit dehydrogenase-like oxidoreductase (DUF2520 family)